jgi:hypothetical protein
MQRAALPGTAVNSRERPSLGSLAVALAAARLRGRSSWSVADLAARLADGPDAMAAGSRSLRSVFDLSYTALSEPARRMFRLLGVIPGDDFTVEEAAAIAGLEPSAAQILLDDLYDENLLQEKSSGRYSLHALLRAYARCQATAQVDEPAAHGEEMEQGVRQQRSDQFCGITRTRDLAGEW